MRIVGALFGAEAGSGAVGTGSAWRTGCAGLAGEEATDSGLRAATSACIAGGSVCAIAVGATD
jgi:hypothetical protein